MFTVKHIDTDGTERLYAAETVEVVQNKGIFDDGIYLDWPQPPSAPTNSASAEVEALAMLPRPSAKHVIQFARARSSNDIPPKVFVMNREGSTVATYRL